MHCKIELHIDKDDGIALNGLIEVKGLAFNDHMGESHICWNLKSMDEIVESLKQILAVLEKSVLSTTA